MAFTGRVNPAQHIARELVRRGHEVVWLTGKKFEDRVLVTCARFHATKQSAECDVWTPTSPRGVFTC